MDAVLEHRLECGQPIAGRLPQPLVAPDHLRLPGVPTKSRWRGADFVGWVTRRVTSVVAHLHLDRHDLSVEAAPGPGGRRLALRRETERVGLLASDAAHCGDPLGGLELVGRVIRPVVLPWPARPRPDVGAQRDAAHGLDAAGDADVDGARRDQARDQVVGLLRGAALKVDGRGGDRVGQAGGEPGIARHVGGLFSGLGHAATDDLLDGVRLDARSGDDGLQRQPQQPGWMDSRQPAVATSDRRPHRLHDDRLPHAHAPSSPVGSAACASSFSTAAPTSPGSKAPSCWSAGPWRQPSATPNRPPITSKTRPVTPFDSALASHTTTGETFSGAMTSKPRSGRFIASGKRSSVIRVRAAGAMALAVTPYRPSSAEATVVKATSPALAVA